jgi:fibronectin-binding autotransporter adhesin
MKTLPNLFFYRFSILAVLGSLAPFSTRAAGVVTSPTEASLRAAFAGGGAVTFATSGTITLSAVLAITNNTSIDGAGYSVTLSGSNATEVFLVYTNVQSTLNNLTIANGLTNQGAGMYNAGGTVSMSNVVFSGNQAVGMNGSNSGNSDPYGAPGQAAYGGAIYNLGSLILVNCRFLSNSSSGGNGGNSQTPDSFALGGEAEGGAIYSTGPLAATNCIFIANTAVGGMTGLDGFGGPGEYPGNGFGGAICNQGGTLTSSNCVFVNNSAIAPPPGGGIGIANHGGYAFGGGICNASGMASIVGAVVASNAVSGISGGAGIYHGAGTMTIANCAITRNVGIGGEYLFGEGANSPGWGGGLYNVATAVASDSSFASNTVTGGTMHLAAETTGGPGEGGGVGNSGTLVLLRCTVAGNSAFGGHGPQYSYDGGVGCGGGIYNDGPSLSVVNCTVANNVVKGNLGGNGGNSGDSYGGGIYNTSGSVALTNCTLSGNSALGTPPAGSGTNGVGYGGNIYQAGTMELIETIVTAGVSNNAQGTLTDLGYNISSDASCAFSGPGSLNNTDPKLAPLANNGGLTETMAISLGSPAIDAGISLPGITTDQRGVPRPFGPEPDIGAYEWNGPVPYYANFSLTTLQHINGGWTLSGVGPTNQSFRILVSSNLSDWTPLVTNTSGPFGMYSFTDTTAAGTANRYYRLVSP